jgi:hypothetical protein
MTSEEKKKAREFVYAYNALYTKVDYAQKKVEDLVKEIDVLQEQMLRVRDEEKAFINTLRLIYGTEKINAAYLLEALKEEIV